MCPVMYRRHVMVCACASGLTIGVSASHGYNMYSWIDIQR